MLNHNDFVLSTKESSYLKQDGCYASLGKVPQSYRQKLGNAGSNRNFHIYFLGSLSLADSKDQSVFSSHRMGGVE